MMRLNVNRLLVRRGTIIEISWDVSGMSMPELILTISGKENVLTIETAGTKRIRLGGTSFKNGITIRAYDSNGIQRSVKRHVYAYGTIKEQYDSYTRISPFEKYKEFVKKFWRSYPREKRRLYAILVLLMTCLIFASYNIEITKISIMATMVYVLYLMFKR